MNCSTNPTSVPKECKRVIKIKNHIQPGNDFPLTCYSWVKLSMLKQMIRKRTGVPVPDMRLTFKNIELNRNHWDIEDYDVKKNSVIQLQPKTTLRNRYMINPFETLDEDSEAAHRFHEVKSRVEAALNTGIIPKLTDFGTQGTYFLEGISREPIAIFKAQDEEAFAPNNPRGYKGKFSSPGLRAGILSGEGVDREVAAFLIDQAYGCMLGVPITTYVEFCHPSFKSEEFVIYESDSQTTEKINENVPFKRGSFQLYMKHEDNAGNYGSSLYSVEQAHKIAILDLRIMNCDRNEENILVKKKRVQQQTQTKNLKQAYDFFLIPIDHGYSFPDSFMICQDEVVWFHWDQMRQPFTQQELDYIRHIDPKRDVELIRSKLKFREICLRNFRIAEILLKEGASAGLTIYQIAQLAFRQDADEMSHLEKAVQRAEENYTLNFLVPNKVGNGHHKNGVAPVLAKHANSDRKEKPSSSKVQLGLQLIIEESAELTLQEEPQLDESPTKGENLTMLKRSISQPSLLLTRKVSKDGEKPINQTYTEDFYPHVQWFVSILIEQKSKEETHPKKAYRDRYRSDDL